MAINASWGLGTVDRRSTTDQVLHEIRAAILAGRSRRLSRAHEPLAAESQMLLLWQPTYPGPDYAGDHRMLLTAIEMRDPDVIRLVRRHLELT